ncbi:MULTISPECIES: helix-turn-helix domain-containing protein [Acinetobacter]|uniref:Helix-turn-helix domain-containing protein n=1 Tax=Acinetobacter pecorum TaxID=2762215 RepID=A0ABR8VW76_9GAMM|nr:MULTISPECIES: helix-turn-helix domain-containing protein [Acinetobacter]MBD8008786.1 helix-turn-helix domain-containing protein [Acinetobacter pecorum]MCJ0929287.1 helix-turn-helix domain-containing protein [Acinetobacter lwoffii]MCX0336788.1 helix-turn-helix domain-containing protein [Acinetobacter radioresistens]
MNLKEKILFLRSQGLSQSEISNRTGIAQSSVSKIENDEQLDVSYSKGAALDRLVSERTQQNQILASA